MAEAFQSRYYQDGKIFKPKKKTGVENRFNHVELSFLEFENNIHSCIASLKKGGVEMEDIKTRNAYEMIYKLYSMQKREL